MDELKLFFQKHFYTVLVLACILVLIFFKAPFLHLPFYWDEAWSYAVAVYEMYTHKITLLPSQVNQEIFRGHPLFFYFTTSILAKISGFNSLAMHVWMFAITCVLCIVFYVQTSKVYNKSIALLAFVFLIFQHSFIVQSSFLLPEIFIAVFAILSFYFYFRNQVGYYLITACMLVLTKESGIVAILSVLFHLLLISIYNRELNKKAIKKMFIYAIPLLIFLVFILLQKLKWGWMLFPEHTGYLDFSLSTIKARLLTIADYLFYSENRIIYSSLILLLLCLNLIFKKQNFLSKNISSKILLYLIFIVFYSLFTAINFYTTRYLISLLPIIAIIFANITYHFFNREYSVLGVSVLTALYFILAYYKIPLKNLGDCGKTYVESVVTQKALFDNFISKNKSANYHADFLTNVNLTHPETGYLNTAEVMKTVALNEANLIIATAIEPKQEIIETLTKTNAIELVFENKTKFAWAKVYKIK